PGGGEAMAIVTDDRCRCVSGAARARSRWQGGGVRRLQRSAGAGWPRLAARLAPQARSAAIAALAALAYARRGMAAGSRATGRARYRDLANLDRGATGILCRTHGARQGL